MSLAIYANAADLAQRIDAFNPRYHQDYFRVREAARIWLSQTPSFESTLRLAHLVCNALKSWGAGKRKAPRCHTANAVAEALCNREFHVTLVKLANSFNYLGIAAGHRRLLSGAPFGRVSQFDTALLTALRLLADAFMVDNTNVTYPMKALLLITGLMPAFDGQVKGGLRAAGLTGVDKSRYLLPAAACADADKICVLPFYIAECVASERALLDAAILESRYPALKNEYGRLFDIFFFLQGKCSPTNVPLRFAFVNSGRRWYEA